MSEYRLVIPCLMGVEGLVGNELRDMGAQNVEPQNGRVFFDGSEESVEPLWREGSHSAGRIQGCIL